MEKNSQMMIRMEIIRMNKLFKYLIKPSGIRFLVIVLLLALFLFLNQIYGSFLLAKATNQETMYMIGRTCDMSRDNCERQYFKNDLDDIDAIRGEADSYFADILIKEDQRGYTGSCPCPDDYDRRGYSCGRRSSYSKGGKISYCYRGDVPSEKIDQRRSELIAAIQTKIDKEIKRGLEIYNQRYTLYLVLVIFCILFYSEYQKGSVDQIIKFFKKRNEKVPLYFIADYAEHKRFDKALIASSLSNELLEKGIALKDDPKLQQIIDRAIANEIRFAQVESPEDLTELFIAVRLMVSEQDDPEIDMTLFRFFNSGFKPWGKDVQDFIANSWFTEEERAYLKSFVQKHFLDQVTLKEQISALKQGSKERARLARKNAKQA